VPYARGVEAVDRVLAVAEVLLIAASIVLLLRARTARSWTLAVALTVTVALTLAHPIGISAEKGTTIPEGAVEHGATDINVAEIAGLPLMPFTLYKRERIGTGLVENVSTDSLRVRSWVWPFLLTSGGDVAGMCADVFEPCWHPEWRDSDKPVLRENEAARNVSVWSKDADYWVRVDNRHHQTTSAVPAEFVYRLRPALTSWWGLAYWVLAAGIILVLPRQRRSSSTPPEPGAGTRSHAGR
jgi:hypothetical protein